MWSVALRVGGCGRGGGWFVVLRRPIRGISSVIRASQVAPLRLWRLNVVSRRLVCGVVRGGAIHDARCRNGTCGRSRCVSVDAGGAGGGWFAVFRWLVCGVARGGAIHDARCRNGTCGWSRCVSADVGGAMAECCFASVGLQRSRGGAIHDARCRNGTCGRSRCVSADAGGAAVGLRHCVGHSGVTSGAPTFAGG